MVSFGLPNGFGALWACLGWLACGTLALADEPAPLPAAVEVPLVITTHKEGEVAVPTVQVADKHATWQTCSWADATRLEPLPASETEPARARLTVTTADLGKAAIAIRLEEGLDLDWYRLLELELHSPAAINRPLLVTLGGLSGEPPTWFESAPRLVPGKPGLTVAFEPGKPEWKTETTTWRYATTPAKRGVQSQLFVLIHGLLTDEQVTVVRLRALPHEGKTAPAPPTDRQLPARPEGAPAADLEAGRVAGIGRYVRQTLREYAADLRAAGLTQEAQGYDFGEP